MATLPLHHEYRISRNGEYLGLLPVKSEFAYSWQINNVGVPLTLTVGQSLDVARLASDPIETEAGLPLETEDSRTLYIERQPNVFGDSNPKNLLQNDNDIEVIEYSSRYPNGKVVYTGYISKVKGTIGSADDVTVTCLMQSQDLDNYLMFDGTALALDQSQADLSGGVFDFSSDPLATIGESFTIGVGVTRLAAITLRLQSGTGAPQSVSLGVWNTPAEAFAGVTPLTTVTLTVDHVTDSDYQFIFPAPLTVSPGQKLFFATNFSLTKIGFSSTKVYGGGGMYLWGTGSGAPIGPASSQDLYFKTYSTTDSTEITYTNEDLSDILNDFMGLYIASGGRVAIPPGGFTPSGTVATYTFKLATVFEGIQKILEFSPSDRYYIVDPADNTLYYNEASVTADVVLVKGEHIESLELEATKEGITNLVYFSGGDDGTGDNIFVRITDAFSTARRGLERLSDNRVKGASGEDQAITLSQNYIDRHNSETYIGTVTFKDKFFDLTLIKPGLMVGFSNNGNFIDNLLLQIVGLNRQSHQVVAQIGTLQKRESAKVQAIKKALTDAQTIANPNIPM